MNWNINPLEDPAARNRRDRERQLRKVRALAEHKRRKDKAIEDYKTIQSAARVAAEVKKPNKKITISPSKQPDTASPLVPLVQQYNEYRVIGLPDKKLELTPDQAGILMWIWQTYGNDPWTWKSIQAGLGKYTPLLQCFKSRPGAKSALFEEVGRGRYRLRVRFTD